MAFSILLEDCDLEKIVIVGGGIAGFTCLNALLDKQISPLLIEGGQIGSPKMCGEFLAPQALNILEQWNIGPIMHIQQARFHSSSRNFNLSFQDKAGGFMRSEAEYQLSARARKLQGRILENAPINKIVPPTSTTPYLLYLKSGEVIETETAIFATGKWLPNDEKKIPLPYYGIKLHINQIFSPNKLEMYSKAGVYFGVIPVSHTQSNMTCLIKHSKIMKQESKYFFLDLMNQFPKFKFLLKNINLEEVDWLTGLSPDFKIKKLPLWKNAYWIGDALVSFPPAIGYGFAHSVNSALMAADFYLQKKSDDFNKIIYEGIHIKFFLGKLMHHIMLQPFLSSMVFPFLKNSPWFLNKCLKCLGYLRT